MIVNSATWPQTRALLQVATSECRPSIVPTTGRKRRKLHREAIRDGYRGARTFHVQVWPSGGSYAAWIASTCLNAQD